MSTESHDLAINIVLAPPTYNRVDALRYLTGHASVPSMALRLIDAVLLDDPEAIPIPERSGPLTYPRDKVFMRPPEPTVIAILEGAELHRMAPSRFALHVVEHSLEKASQAMPEVDTIEAIRSRRRVTQQNALYFPGE